MTKKKNSLQQNNQPLTLSALQDALKPLEGRFDSLEGRFDKLEKTVERNTEDINHLTLLTNALQGSIYGLQRHVLKIQTDVEGLKVDTTELKENAARKEDVKLVLEMQDTLAGMIKKRDESDTLHGGSLNRHGDEIRDHEKRIRALESVIIQR